MGVGGGQGQGSRGVDAAVGRTVPLLSELYPLSGPSSFARTMYVTICCPICAI